MAVHTIGPSTQEAEGADLSEPDASLDLHEFEASLLYKVSSRTARATQRNPGLGVLGGGLVSC